MKLIVQKFGAIAFFIFALSISAAEDDAETKAAIPEIPVEPLSLRNDKALAEQLEAGQAKWLMAGKNKFLGIFKKNSKGKALGSLLILPAPGVTPLASGVLPKLADDLSRYGWHSLAISLPAFDFSGPMPSFPEDPTSGNTEAEDTKQTAGTATEKTATQAPELPDEKSWYEKQQTENMAKLLEYLIAAESELLAQGGKYVIIAQGTTAELVLELISSKVIKPSGLVSLNIQHPTPLRSSSIAANLSKIKIPVLDIYNLPSDELALKRKRKQTSSVYRQSYVPGKGVNYRGSEQLLVNRVRGWLKSRYSN